MIIIGYHKLSHVDLFCTAHNTTYLSTYHLQSETTYILSHLTDISTIPMHGTCYSEITYHLPVWQKKDTNKMVSFNKLRLKSLEMYARPSHTAVN